MTASTPYFDLATPVLPERAPATRGLRAFGRTLAASAVVGTGLGLIVLALVTGLLTGLGLMLAALALLPFAMAWSRLRARLAARGASTGAPAAGGDDTGVVAA